MTEIMLGRCMLRDSCDHEFDKRYVYEPSVFAGGGERGVREREGAVEVHKQSFIKCHAHRNHSTYSSVACAHTPSGGDVCLKKAGDQLPSFPPLLPWCTLVCRFRERRCVP